MLAFYGNIVFVDFIPVLSKTENKPLFVYERGLALLPVLLDSTFSMCSYKIQTEYDFDLKKY